jgi:hypothetical protein
MCAPEIEKMVVYDNIELKAGIQLGGLITRNQNHMGMSEEHCDVASREMEGSAS